MTTAPTSTIEDDLRAILASQVEHYSSEGHLPWYARVIKDSISPEGVRLTTVEVRFWRAMLAEWNTHRVFSRNSASSRAIPYPKQKVKIEVNPAWPVYWGGEQKGMQSGAEVDDLDMVKAMWCDASMDALAWADRFAEKGLHKSIVNRLLEPFMWHTVVNTATDYEGFDFQRVHGAAQKDIAAPALLVREAMAASTPEPIRIGGWHLPYIEEQDKVEAFKIAWEQKGSDEEVQAYALELLKKASASRCARVSYLTHDTQERSVVKDQGTFAKLTERIDNPDDPIHWSPLEHVATPCQHESITVQAADPYDLYEAGTAFTGKPIIKTYTLRPGHLGNLRGWDQYRHILGGRNA